MKVQGEKSAVEAFNRIYGEEERNGENGMQGL